MKMKIVADSSANLLALPDIDFGVVPLHIMLMLSFVSPLQVLCPVHITVLLSLRTSMNTIIPAERYMF